MKKLLSAIALSALMTLTASAETIKIGVAGPHSGDLASYGIPGKQSCRSLR